jgi:hypothetical protein
VVLLQELLLLPHHVAGTVRLSEVRHDVVAALNELQRPDERRIMSKGTV